MNLLTSSVVRNLLNGGIRMCGHIERISEQSLRTNASQWSHPARRKRGGGEEEETHTHTRARTHTWKYEMKKKVRYGRPTLCESSSWQRHEVITCKSSAAPIMLMELDTFMGEFNSLQILSSEYPFQLLHWVTDTVYSTLLSSSVRG
jgi:hypothetical protein